MSFFNKILEKLGIRKDTDETEGAGTSTASRPSAPAPSSRPTGKAPDSRSETPSPTSRETARPATQSRAGARRATSGPARPNVNAPARAPAQAPMSEVDVVKKLETLSAGKGLNWKVSIVDLMKLLDLDSSREARNELAQELGAPADVMSDSARMNTWLHKEVLRRVAQNGGNIPRELLD
jgi:hypothetical protein